MKASRAAETEVAMMSDCPFCTALLDKASILYEDDKLAVVLPLKTVARGHLRVIPKSHRTVLQDYEDTDIEHFFYAASFTATALFENLQAQGTNIIANTGSKLNQKTHFHIDVIARWSEDNLNFLWTPNRLPEEEMKSVQGIIKDKTDMIGLARKEKEVVVLDKKPEPLGGKAPEPEKTDSSKEKPSEEKAEKPETATPEKSEEEKEENYMVRQLRRMP